VALDLRRYVESLCVVIVVGLEFGPTTRTETRSRWILVSTLIAEDRGHTHSSAIKAS